MKKIILLIAAFLISSPAIASSDWTSELHLWEALGPSQFENALSPNGKFTIRQVFYRGTTASRLGIISSSDDSVKYIIDASPDPRYTTFIWSPGGQYLALHDSSATHSALRVFYVATDGIKELHVPNLKAFATEKLSVSETEISSSGQIPDHWVSNQNLEAKVRFKLKNQETKFASVSLVISDTSIEIVRNVANG